MTQTKLAEPLELELPLEQRTPAEAFMAYLAANSEVAPSHSFLARSARQAEPPTFYYTLPRGVVLLFPDWVVFLTDKNTAPGFGVMFGEFCEQMKAQMPGAI